MIAATLAYSARLTVAAPHATFTASMPGGIVYGEEGYGEEGYSSTGELTGAGTYTATVSTAFLDSLDGAAVSHRFRIMFGGVEIPARDLVGGVTLSDTKETPLNEAGFTIRGASRSIFATITTWSQTEVLIYHQHGQHWLGEQAMRETLVFRGVVIPGRTRQTADVEPVVSVSCAGEAARYDRYDLCYEREPFAGLTRGGHIVDALLGAGIAAVDGPPGAVYDKPVFTDQKKPLAWLKEFSEPEGWLWRWNAETNTLEAYQDALKRPPFPPDHVWDVADCQEIACGTPLDPPTRYVLRGMGAIHVDEIGYTVDVAQIEISALYAPKVAVQEQQTDGSVDPVTFSEEEALRVVKRISDQISRRGQSIVSQITVEEGWYNPPAGYLETAGGLGPADGYDWLRVYINEAGDYVSWDREQFIQVGQKARYLYYNEPDGSLAAEDITEWRWYAKESGVRETGGGSWLAARVVGADDRSYAPVGSKQITQFGIAEKLERRFTYDGTTGAQAQERTNRYGWYNPHTAVALAPPTVGTVTGFYETYDGTGRELAYPDFRLVGETIKTNILGQGGELRGIVEQTSGYAVAKSANGYYDWGEFRSNRTVETIQITDTKNTSYTRLSENSYEESITDASGTRSQTYSGRVPLARFQGSAWTRLTQEPLELIEDDPAAESLWGFNRAVLSSDYLQSLDEARRMIATRRFHDYARPVTVKRPMTAAKEGDTVLVIDPRQGLHHLCFLAKRDRTIDPGRGLAEGTYELEADFG